MGQLPMEKGIVRMMSNKSNQPETTTAHNATLTGEIQIREVSQLWDQMADEAMQRYEAVLEASRFAMGERLAAMAIGPTQGEVEALRAQKNAAYTERNRLVALLAALFPSSLERHPDEDTAWENEWRWICFIDLPTGQASWHLHDSELPLFNHVPRNQGRKWDGHTTEEKYQRIQQVLPFLPKIRLRIPPEILAGSR